MYTTIIHPLRKAYNLSIQEYCVLDTICHLSNNKKYGGWCVKSKANIADDLDLGERTVYRIIDNLIERGLIDKDEETKYLRINDEWTENIANKDKWSLSGKSVAMIGKHDLSVALPKGQGHCQNDSQALPKWQSDTAKMADNNNIYNNINNIYEQFEKFWSKYPNKKGKKQAISKFTKLIKAGVTLKELLLAIDKYKRDTDPKYYKHGSTWLNQEVFRDYEQVEIKKREIIEEENDIHWNI